MSLLFRQILHNAKTFRNETQLLMFNRKLSIVPTLYDGDKDPTSIFFSPNVQQLLKRLTRPDFAKIFSKRMNRGHEKLKTPTYKFMTDEELERAYRKAQKKAVQLLQMPPVVLVNKHVDQVLSKDAGMTGFDTSKYIFTDISFGVPNEHRLIVERDVDGTLRNCDHETRKRMNQAYFPREGRKIREPIMFSDEEALHRLLDSQQYKFLLDRACLQYEPDEFGYQRVTSIVYQHIDIKHLFNVLRSTRHFGPFAFYLTWNQMMDNLMLELLQSGFIRDAVCLSALRHEIHQDISKGDQAKAIVTEILSTPIQITKPDRLSEEDIRIDNGCVEFIEQYIQNNSAMKSQHELALQGFRENYQQLVDLSRGLRKAHGIA